MKRVPLLSAAITLLSVCLALAQDPPPNLVQNGSFAIAGDGGLAKGCSATGAMTRATVEREAGRLCQKVETPGRSAFTLWQEVSVKPNVTLCLTAWVKSDDRVVGRCGALTMAYTDQGQ